MRVCVFSGSADGHGSAYVEAARDLGRCIAEAGCGLVYGGASVGTMNAVADGALAVGGTVIGVIPHTLVDRELAHRGLSELHVVDGMHERKAMMAALADSFVALPGGIGTLEELFEVWTWRKLGLQPKPLGLLDVAGFYDSFAPFLDHLVHIGFLGSTDRDLLQVESDPRLLLKELLRTG